MLTHTINNRVVAPLVGCRYYCGIVTQYPQVSSQSLAYSICYWPTRARNLTCAHDTNGAILPKVIHIELPWLHPTGHTGQNCNPFKLWWNLRSKHGPHIQCQSSRNTLVQPEVSAAIGVMLVVLAQGNLMSDVTTPKINHHHTLIDCTATNHYKSSPLKSHN